MLGNIAFLYRKDKRWFKPAEVTQALYRVCKAHLETQGVKVTLLCRSLEWEVRVGNGVLHIHSTGRRLESKHPRGFGMGWVMCVVHEYLARELNATLGDEGVAERWEPEPDKYNTPEKYAEIGVEHISDPHMRNSMYNSKLREINDLLNWSAV